MIASSSKIAQPVGSRATNKTPPRHGHILPSCLPQVSNQSPPLPSTSRRQHVLVSRRPPPSFCPRRQKRNTENEPDTFNKPCLKSNSDANRLVCKKYSHTEAAIPRRRLKYDSWCLPGQRHQKERAPPRRNRCRRVTVSCARFQPSPSPFLPPLPLPPLVYCQANTPVRLSTRLLVSCVFLTLAPYNIHHWSHSQEDPTSRA